MWILKYRERERERERETVTTWGTLVWECSLGGRVAFWGGVSILKMYGFLPRQIGELE